MTDRTQKERVLREIYAARVNGDLDAIERAFSPTMYYHMMGSPGGAETTIQARSFKEFRPLTEQFMKTFIMSDLQIRNIVIEGEKAVVHWQVRIKSGVTGDMAITDLCDIIEFKDGKIASFVEFCDTALAGRLMGASPPGNLS